jgi:hypothetical protein
MSGGISIRFVDFLHFHLDSIVFVAFRWRRFRWFVPPATVEPAAPHSVGQTARRTLCGNRCSSWDFPLSTFDWEYCCQPGNVRLRFPLNPPKRSFDWPHVHAQIPSHRNPSVERFRIHVKGMVCSTGWLDGFPEVGRRGGPWRRRWAKGLLDASTEGENGSLRHGAACQRLCKSRDRAATQPSL